MFWDYYISCFIFIWQLFHESLVWLCAMTCACCRLCSNRSVLSMYPNLLLPEWHILLFLADSQIKRYLYFREDAWRLLHLSTHALEFHVYALGHDGVLAPLDGPVYISTCAWLGGIQVLLVKVSSHNSCETFNIPHGWKCWHIHPIKHIKKSHDVKLF